MAAIPPLCGFEETPLEAFNDVEGGASGHQISPDLLAIPSIAAVAADGGGGAAPASVLTRQQQAEWMQVPEGFEKGPIADAARAYAAANMDVFTWSSPAVRQKMLQPMTHPTLPAFIEGRAGGAEQHATSDDIKPHREMLLGRLHGNFPAVIKGSRKMVSFGTDLLYDLVTRMTNKMGQLEADGKGDSVEYKALQSISTIYQTRHLMESVFRASGPHTQLAPHPQGSLSRDIHSHATCMVLHIKDSLSPGLSGTARGGDHQDHSDGHAARRDDHLSVHALQGRAAALPGDPARRDAHLWAGRGVGHEGAANEHRGGAPVPRPGTAV